MIAMDSAPQPRGRAASAGPPNRFASTHCEIDWEQLADDELEPRVRSVPTEFLPDASQSIISENDSPDVPFRYSINPYRGCEHGCAYCYARPTHEYLGFDAGLDFESKILVKHDAPRLLRAFLARPSWMPEMISLSGVTDCYQPVERRLKITRQLLEVLLEARQPVGIVTKNARIVRDLDLLRPLAEQNLVHANLSITTLDAELAGALEPRTSRPAARLEAVRRLTAAGVPTRVLVAPIIPGLNDHEVPHILAAARESGASAAGYLVLRLPLAVRPVFTEWLAHHYPDKQSRVEGLVRAVRGGRMNSSQFGKRMRGEGEYAEQIARTFKVFAKRLGLDRRLPELDATRFRPPAAPGGQMSLF